MIAVGTQKRRRIATALEAIRSFERTRRKKWRGPFSAADSARQAKLGSREEATQVEPAYRGHGAPMAEIGPEILQPAMIRDERRLRLDDHQIPRPPSGGDLEHQSGLVPGRTRRLDPRIDDVAGDDDFLIHVKLPNGFCLRRGREARNLDLMHSS